MCSNKFTKGTVIVEYKPSVYMYMYVYISINLLIKVSGFFHDLRKRNAKL